MKDLKSVSGGAYVVPSSKQSDGWAVGVIALAVLGIVSAAVGGTLLGIRASKIAGSILLGAVPILWGAAVVLARWGQLPTSPPTLGEGRFGRVYPIQVGKIHFALKVSKSGGRGQYRKAMVIGNLGVPALVHHYDYVEIREGGFQGRMELIEGTTLHSHLRKDTASKALLIRFLRAYRSVIEMRVLPGDLHSNNIMVTPDGEIRFVDLDSYLFVGEKNEYLWSRLFMLAKLCKEISNEADTKQVIALGREWNAGGQELTEEHFSQLVQAVDALLTQLENN